MNLKKIRSVAATLRAMLEARHIPKKRMPKQGNFSNDRKTACKQMLAHAHWLLAVSMPALLSDKRRLRSRSGHGKIGRHLGSAQTLLWTAGILNRKDLMDQNRKNRTTKKRT
jgi:hypothetical protein